MKFGKKFESYLTSSQKIHGAHVSFKPLKKLLKRCRGCPQAATAVLAEQVSTELPARTCQEKPCVACKELFFRQLIVEVELVMLTFNKSAKWLLKMPLLRGGLLQLLCCLHGSSESEMIQEGRALLAYAGMNHLAVRKLVKKFDKLHGRGEVDGLSELHARVLALDGQLMRSPFLLELHALAPNLQGDAAVPRELAVPEAAAHLGPTAKHVEREALVPQGLQNLETSELRTRPDTSCPICLEELFNPVALGCGHIFCTQCVCEAVNLPAAFGLRHASESAKCPMCRQQGVFVNTMVLTKLGSMLKVKNPQYWNKRLLEEREGNRRHLARYWEKAAEADRRAVPSSPPQFQLV